MFETIENEPSRSGGITGTIRRLLESTSGFLATKLELIGVELQEEKRRILELLILTAAALLFGVLALTVFTVGIVALFLAKESLPLALIVMSGCYLAISISLFLWVQRKAQIATRVFETTVEELKKDTEWVNRHL
jgi:uncharacterized membrane protein YqjE